MINIVKTTNARDAFQCNACGEYGPTITEIKTAIRPGIWNVLSLCPNCIRELTKELTSNKYLNNDNCDIMEASCKDPECPHKDRTWRNVHNVPSGGRGL